MCDSRVREADISIIILAAGLSRRMRECDKLLLPLSDGRLMIESAIDLASSMPVHERILVTTSDRLRQIKSYKGIKVVENLRPEEGQSESIRLGVMAATGDYYLFMAADQPMLDAKVLNWLVEGARDNPGKIIYPLVSGMPCNPVIFPNTFKDDLLSLEGDEGGRKIIKRHPNACFAPEANAKWQKKFIDIDTLEEYSKL